MRETSQADYLHNFPLRTLAASSEPHQYPSAPDPGMERRLEEAFGVGDLNRFLTSTESQALLVVEDGQLVFERYANGAGPDTTLTNGPSRSRQRHE